MWGEGNVEYEKHTFYYTIPARKQKYTPDFKHKGKKLIVESKGRFKPDDRRKMIQIKQEYPDYTICIFFSSGDKPINKGSKTTYGMWCEENGFDWSDLKRGLPETWK